MRSRFFSKAAMAATFLAGCGMFSESEARAGWLSHNRRGDCDGGLTRAQTKAMSACELARARKLADLSCAELSQIAESDRHAANIRALAGYSQRFPLHTAQPAR